MTPVMPEAPQNRLMQPQGGPPAPAGPPGGMMPPQNALMAPPGAPAPAAPPPSPEEVQEARKHLGAIMDALSSVASQARAAT